MSLQVSTFVNGRWRQNCYLIADSQKDVLIVDPGSSIPWCWAAGVPAR